MSIKPKEKPVAVALNMPQSIAEIQQPKDFIAEIDAELNREIVQRHSYFQLKYFLIGKEPTLQSKMWQCLRELKARREALVAADLEIEECKDKVELLGIAIERLKARLEKLRQKSGKSVEFRVRELNIHVRRNERQKKAGEESLIQLADKKKWLLEEARFFLESFKNLQQLEPLKPFDDINAQREYWGEKLFNKINLKMLLQSPIDMELIETILALPDDMPVKVKTVNQLNSVQEALVKLTHQQRQALEERKED